MAEPGTVVVLDGGLVGVLPSGDLAVFDAQGGCEECCGGGGGGPTGICGCFPLVYSDRRCGVPRAMVGTPGWELRVVGEVSYSESVVDLTFGVVRSDVRTQVRAFDVRRLFSEDRGGECQGQGFLPSPGYLEFVQSAPAGRDRYLAPRFRFDVLAGNNEPANTQGWNIPTNLRSAWGLVGPYEYEPPRTPSMYMFAGQGGGGNFFIESQVGGLGFGALAVWIGDDAPGGGGGGGGGGGVGGAAFAQASVEGSRSAAELATFYESAFEVSGGAGTLVRRRQGCTYVVERGFDVAYSGRRGVSQVIETRVAFAASWRVEMAMIECVEALVDPRVRDAAEAGLRRCRGCGE